MDRFAPQRTAPLHALVGESVSVRTTLLGTVAAAALMGSLAVPAGAATALEAPPAAPAAASDADQIEGVRLTATHVSGAEVEVSPQMLEHILQTEPNITHPGPQRPGRNLGPGVVNPLVHGEQQGATWITYNIYFNHDETVRIAQGGGTLGAVGYILRLIPSLPVEVVGMIVGIGGAVITGWALGALSVNSCVMLKYSYAIKKITPHWHTKQWC